MIQAKVPIYPGEDAKFAPDAGKRMIGQRTSDGFLVTDAEQDGGDVIWLTIQNDDLEVSPLILKEGDVGFSPRRGRR